MQLNLCLLFTLLLSITAKSQVLVSQNPNGTAHGSSQFEVRSNQKGFLPPVMTTQERKNISNPAEGLLVFDSTKQLMFVFTKLGWQSFNLTPESSSVSNGTAFPNPGFNTNDQAGHRVEILGDYAYLGAWGSIISGKLDQGAV